MVLERRDTRDFDSFWDGVWWALLSREDVRLLTLTRPGGTGRTRLAAPATAELAARYSHDVWWVSLAPLRDPELVLAASVQPLREHGLYGVWQSCRG